jgi:hypothetical protein
MPGAKGSSSRTARRASPGHIPADCRPVAH